MPPTARSLALASGLLASLAVSSAARAQPADPAAAEALYKSGLELADAGDQKGACAKFDASLALNVAVTTLVQIARCREAEGRLTEALVTYKRAATLNQDTESESRRAALEQVIRESQSTLGPRIPRLTITVSPAGEGLRVSRDGVALPLAALGEAMPVDPGAHELVVESPGFSPERRAVTLTEGASETLTFSLVRLPSPAPAAAPALPPAAPEAEKPLWPWLVGGAGLLFVGAGVAFRVDQAAAESRLDEECGAERLCDPGSAYDPADDNARKDRDFALFLGLSGVGLGAVGVAVWGLATGGDEASSGLRVTPRVGEGGAGLVLDGAL
jgi:tetratricopeptide (TPR) repeat protein